MEKSAPAPQPKDDDDEYTEQKSLSSVVNQGDGALNFVLGNDVHGRLWV